MSAAEPALAAPALRTPPPDAPEDDLATRLRGLTAGRIVVILFLLAATTVFGLGPSLSAMERGTVEALLYSTTVAVVVLTIGYAFALRRLTTTDGLRRLAYVQLVGDALFSACMVVMTGGTSSAFTFFFSLTIINGAVLLYRPGAWVTAGVSALLLLGVGLLELMAFDSPSLAFLRPHEFGPVLGAHVVGLGPRVRAILTSVLYNGVAFAGVAFLASRLAEKARRKEEQLVANRSSLRDLRALHRNIVSSLQSGLVTTDVHGVVTYCNEAARRLSGRSREQFEGVRLVDLFGEVAGHLSDAPGRTRLSTEVEVNGRARIFGWTTSVLSGADGLPIGHVLSFQDITDIEAMAQQVQRAERLSAIGRVAASVAHEIRNPLASISGSIQLLGATTELDDDGRRLMEIVRREIAGLDAWIGDLLSYARPRRGRAVAVPLGEMVRETVEILQNDEGAAKLRFEVHVDDALRVQVEPTSLRQVVWNLLKNAVEASEGSATVWVDVRREALDGQELGCLEVRDQGRGMSPETVERLFEPFYTTRPEGTGLGMAMVERIVREHHGYIEVTSREGHGSTLRVLLPVARPASPVDGDASESQA